VMPMSPTMSVRLGLVALLAALLAGAAVAAPGDPERRAIRPADEAWARRINLTLRDLPPGFQQAPARSGDSSSALTCKGFAPDLSDLTVTGDAQSRPFFRRDGTSIFSGAEVFRTVHDAREDWRRTVRREALPCVATIIEQQSTQSVRMKVVSSAVRTAPRLGDRTASFRIVASVTASGVHIKAWMDVLGVGRGRADATLFVLAFRSQPSAVLERRLLGKLAARL
jgi:hypothetical protein